MKRQLARCVAAAVFGAFLVSGCGQTAKSTEMGADTPAAVENSAEDETANAADSAEETEPALTEPESVEAAVEEAEETGRSVDLEAEFEILPTALDMMVHYGMLYSDLGEDPGSEFWKAFESSLLCNSWCAPFWELTDKYGSVWGNQEVAYAGKLLTDHDLICEEYPEGLDVADAYSPWLHIRENVNGKMTAGPDGTVLLTYDFIWGDSSLAFICNDTRVSAVLKENPLSPLDGYSVESLSAELIYTGVNWSDDAEQISVDENGNAADFTPQVEDAEVWVLEDSYYVAECSNTPEGEQIYLISERRDGNYMEVFGMRKDANGGYEVWSTVDGERKISPVDPYEYDYLQDYLRVE